MKRKAVNIFRASVQTVSKSRKRVRRLVMPGHSVIKAEGKIGISILILCIIIITWFEESGRRPLGTVHRPSAFAV